MKVSFQSSRSFKAARTVSLAAMALAFLGMPATAQEGDEPNALTPTIQAGRPYSPYAAAQFSDHGAVRRHPCAYGIVGGCRRRRHQASAARCLSLRTWRGDRFEHRPAGQAADAPRLLHDHRPLGWHGRHRRYSEGGAQYPGRSRRPSVPRGLQEGRRRRRARPPRT